MALIVFGAMGALGLVVTSTSAQASQPQHECIGAEAAVTEHVQGAFRSLSSAYRNALPGPEGVRLRDAKVEALIRQYTAGQRFASEVLRVPWSTLSDAKRADWERVLGALLERRVTRALNAPLRYRLEVDRVQVERACA